MISIVGIENVRPYVDGSDTGEVAFKLEKRFEVGKRFIEFIEPSLETKFMSAYETELKRFNYDFDKAFERALFLISQWLTKEWREYILMEKHGIKTQASVNDPKGPRQSFVDTGEYFKNMQVRLVNQ